MNVLRHGPTLARPGRLAPVGGQYRRWPVALLALLVLGGLAYWHEQRPAPRPRPLAASPAPSPSDAPSPSPVAATSPAVPPPPPPPASAAPAPSSIDRYAPVGKRTGGCLRLVIALDVSGSMAGYATYRDAALQQLLTWIQRHLTAADQVAVVDFAGTVGVRQRPISVQRRVTLGASPFVLGGSEFRPLLTTAAGFPSTRCRTALILLSDGQLSDLPATADESRTLLGAAKVAHVRLLVPDPSIVAPPAWSVALPKAVPVAFDGTDPDATALAIGRTVAELMGQKLAVI